MDIEGTGLSLGNTMALRDGAACNGSAPAAFFGAGHSLLDVLERVEAQQSALGAASRMTIAMRGGQCA